MSNKRLGILGGGQLAMMLADAARPLGVEVLVLNDVADCSAKSNAKIIVCDLNDSIRLPKLVEEVDSVTFEFENIPLESVSSISKFKPVFPSEKSLYITQHRAREKEFVKNLGIPTPKFVFASNSLEIANHIQELNYQCVIKTCSSGYDGKGQWRVNSKEEFEAIGEIKVDIIAEELVKFDREVSMIIVRASSGEIKPYDLCENVHVSGTLVRTRNINQEAQTKLDQNIFNLALGYATKLAEALDYVGVLAIEFFQIGNKLLFNEYAPRVHNSGHWTIEGAETSQFENHVRACLGMPLGSTRSIGYSWMYNLLGIEGDKSRIQATKGAHYHWYNKEIKAKRKLGHVTICDPSSEVAENTFKILFGEGAS